MQKSKNKYRNLVIKLIVSIGLFAFLLSKIDQKLLFEKIQLLDKSFIPLVLIFLILNYIISSYRWKALLIFENCERVTVGYLVSLYFVGSFFNNFAPTSIGGDVFKVYKLGKKIDNTTNAFSATFMERFSGVLVLFLISLLSLVNILGFWILLLFLWFFLGSYLGLFTVKKLSKKIKLLERIYNSLKQYRRVPKVLITALLTSVIVQLFSIFTQYFIFLSLGFKLPVVFALLIFPLITLASFFIPSLNGIGVQDVLYVALFQFVGIPQEVALSASILYHLFRLFVSLIGGVIFLTNKEI